MCVCAECCPFTQGRVEQVHSPATTNKAGTSLPALVCTPVSVDVRKAAADPAYCNPTILYIENGWATGDISLSPARCSLLEIKKRDQGVVHGNVPLTSQD